MVGSHFNNQGKIIYEVYLGCSKTSRSPLPPAKSLNIYIETLTGFSHIHHPGGLNSILLSQSCILEKGYKHGNGRRNMHSKDRGGSKQPQIAQIQLANPSAVSSSQRLPPTNPNAILCPVQHHSPQLFRELLYNILQVLPLLYTAQPYLRV